MRLERKQKQYLWIALFMFLCFTFYFLLLTRTFEENQIHPYQGTAHDRNGTPIN